MTKHAPTIEEQAVAEEVTVSGLRITRVGVGHYLCKSRSIPGVSYSVDLSNYAGLGSCNCTDFNIRRYPAWKKARKRLDAFRCFHIRQVRNHVLDQMIDHINNRQNE